MRLASIALALLAASTALAAPPARQRTPTIDELCRAGYRDYLTRNLMPNCQPNPFAVRQATAMYFRAQRDEQKKTQSLNQPVRQLTR